VSPGDLLEAMIRVGGGELRSAMIKAAALGLPKVPSIGGTGTTSSSSPPKGLTTNRVSQQPAPVPPLERTNQDSVLSQKSIVPPVI
jgi:hypothetical protein